MPRMAFIMDLVVLAMAIFLWGFSPLDSWAADKLRFGIPAKMSPPYYLVLSAAEEKGIWTRNGLEVEVFYVRGGVPLMSAAATGRIDMGGMTAIGLLPPISRGVPVIMIAEWVRRFNWGIYVRSKSPFKKAEDLVGARIGVLAIGSTEYFYGRSALSALGIIEKIKFVGAGGLEAKQAAIEASAIDGGIDSGAVMVRLVAAGRMRELVRINDYLPRDWMEHVLFARKELVKNQPDTAKKAVNAILAALDFVRNNSSWAVEKIKLESGFSAEEASMALASFQFSETGRINQTALESVRSYAIRFGLALEEKTPPVENLYTREFTD